MADGRQAASSGYTLSELADEMLRLGCVDAVNLDGGGSTTYAARYAGESALTVANSPSDGVERLVSSSLMIVTQAEASGVFGEAVLNPNNDVYTPGSEIQFQAKAVDTNGFAMEMPANVTWRLTPESEALGTIDANGLFIANDGIEGTVGVELVYEEKVVGTTSVEIYYPDTLKFGSNELSLGFGAESDLGLHALHNHREVIIKDGDLAWTIGVSDNEQYPEIGTMRGNTFVASEDATNSTAIVSVAGSGQEGNICVDIRYGGATADRCLGFRGPYRRNDRTDDSRRRILQCQRRRKPVSNLSLQQRQRERRNCTYFQRRTRADGKLFPSHEL